MSMNSFCPTPYAALNAVLNELIVRVRTTLGRNFVAAYLLGSFAVGDFDEDSDVDFLVVIERNLSEEEVKALQEMHSLIHEMESDWARHLEGSYFPRAVLNNPAAVKLEKLWYLDNGSRTLVPSIHDNQWVERRVAYHHGIALNGPPARTLFAPVPTDALKREVSETVRDWGKSLLNNPSQINSCWYQSFVVVSYCRMLQTIETGEVRSKAAGVSWALANLNPRWAGLIQQAWDDRPDPTAKGRMAANPELLDATLKFVRFAIERISPSCSGI